MAAKNKESVETAESVQLEEIAESVERVETAAPVKPAPAPAESVYSAEDLIANFKAFKTSKEIVTVALRQAGIKTATFTEAKNIIDKFKNKEVK